MAWVYILTNRRRTVLYVGATRDIFTRMWEHRTKQNPKSFTAKYELSHLVYLEGFEDVDNAFMRERFIKGKTRKWKEALVEKYNPYWKELIP